MCQLNVTYNVTLAALCSLTFLVTFAAHFSLVNAIVV